MRRFCLVLTLAVAAGCASTPKKPDQAALQAAALAASLAKADARILEGCYDCLKEARDLYAAAVSPTRPDVLARQFEAELLIVLRERELAIDSTAAVARARATAQLLPAIVEADRYLAIVDAVPNDELGTPQRDDLAFRRARTEYISRINAEVDWLNAATTTSLRAPARTYLGYAIDCMYSARGRGDRPMSRIAMGRPTPAPDAPPLVMYRAAICLEPNPKMLDDVRTAVPAFIETSFFQARREVAAAKNTGGAKARELLTEVYGAFPKSRSVTYLFGNYYQLVGDCRQGLRYYEETLTMASQHENALLGRTVCLTFVKRPDDAVTAATTQIGFGAHIAMGYYWRAWNEHFVLKQLDVARRDIDSAKNAARNQEILTLAGIIEHDQDDLDLAEKDLLAARLGEQGQRNCIAAWYLGLVHLKRKTWVDSGTHFEAAMNCYGKDVTEAEEGLAYMQSRTDLDPEFRARQLESFQIAVDTGKTQRYAAAFNAANYYATGGTFAKAKVLVEIAAENADLAPKVAILREYLKDKGGD